MIDYKRSMYSTVLVSFQRELRIKIEGFIDEMSRHSPNENIAIEGAGLSLIILFCEGSLRNQSSYVVSIFVILTSGMDSRPEA